MWFLLQLPGCLTQAECARHIKSDMRIAHLQVTLQRVRSEDPKQLRALCGSAFKRGPPPPSQRVRPFVYSLAQCPSQSAQVQWMSEPGLPAVARQQWQRCVWFLYEPFVQRLCKTARAHVVTAPSFAILQDRPAKLPVQECGSLGRSHIPGMERHLDYSVFKDSQWHSDCGLEGMPFFMRPVCRMLCWCRSKNVRMCAQGCCRCILLCALRFDT